MSTKDNPVDDLPRKLLISHKKSPVEDGEVFLLEHTDGTTETAWNLIAAEAGHQDIDSCYCHLDHNDIHGNYYWGTSGLVESESVIISDYELEIVFNVWTDHYEDDVDCESKWFVTIPQRSLYQFGEWTCEHDIELYYSSEILPLVKGGSFGKFATGIGLWLYDKLAGVTVEDKRKILSKEKTLNIEPSLRNDILKGAGYYAEYRTNDARLTLEIIKTAVQLKAAAINYTAATELLYENNKDRKSK